MEIRIYKTKDGKQPFIKWYDDLKDQSYQLRIRKRLRQITFDNFGDSKSVGDGVYELRFFLAKVIEFIMPKKVMLLFYFCVEEINQLNKRI
jgi:putative addiction module killer protein